MDDSMSLGDEEIIFTSNPEPEKTFVESTVSGVSLLNNCANSWSEILASTSTL